MAGGVALNLLLEAARVSRDIDIFHDAEEAVHFSFATDRRLLEGAGYTVSPLRELPGFVAAVVGKSGDAVRMEWARDSGVPLLPPHGAWPTGVDHVSLRLGHQQGPGDGGST